MSAEDVKVVERFLNALVAGDLDTVFQVVAEDIVLVEAGSIPHEGTFEGHGGLAKLLESIGGHFGGFELGEMNFYDAGEFVVGRMDATFISKSRDRRHSTKVTENYWVRDGLVSYVDVYYKDPAPLLTL